jgi:ATP-dependent DNA helicase
MSLPPSPFSSSSALLHFSRGLSWKEISLTVQEDWATLYKGWKICRIDGSTSQQSRREQMVEFNEGGDSPDATKLFLLSTRAGGLGVNLVAAE